MSLINDPELFDVAHFEQELSASTTPLPVYRATLKRAQEVLSQRWLEGRTATELVPLRASLVDEFLKRIWAIFFPANKDQIALIAVGGYGRHELHPGSDIDIMILCEKDVNRFQQPIESFLTFLWDIGLESGHSVRTLNECIDEAKNDITVVTNIQEARLLTGSKSLYEKQQELCSERHIWPSKDFFQAKLAEQHARHVKFNDTAYNLEPNIKEGPGGLRDIQMIAWVLKRHFGISLLSELVERNILTDSEYQTLHEGQAFLWQIRFGLHVFAGRREDRLLFDLQRRLATHFGYKDTPKRLAVEQFMKQYYRTVMELGRLNELLLQLFQEEILYADESETPVKINRRFQSRKGFIEVTNSRVFLRYPFALIEIFLLLAQHSDLKGIRSGTIRLLRSSLYLIDNDFRNDLGCRSIFIEFLRQPRGITHQLRSMNRYGVLAAYLPEFANIVGQMQHDLFHVYTVDEHTLFVIRNVRRFTIPEYKHEFPLCSKIMESLPKQELLIMAALYHDIAKGRGGDHSELGAVDAYDFCQRHNLAEYDSKFVAWLVQYHLLMSTTAQRKDTSDPEVINEFARKVGDAVHLDYLYLLTVADIRGTSPSLWNAWKDVLLKDLYYETKRAFRRGIEDPLIKSETVAKTKSDALEILLASGSTKESIKNIWSNFNEDYFLRFAVPEIVHHTRSLIKHLPSQQAMVLINPDSERGGTDIFIYGKNHECLFASITQTIDILGLNVVDARLVDTQNNNVIESFLVLDSSGQPVTEPTQLKMLESRLIEAANKEKFEPQVINQLIPRQHKHFKLETSVSFTSPESASHTLMEIVAHDRPGLLSKLGQALMECRVMVKTAKIATFGAKAEDIFMLTSYDGYPLDEKTCECLRVSVARQLDG